MQQLPAGIAIVSAEEVGLSLPALQADVRFAEYDVDVDLASPYEAPEVAEPPPAVRSSDEATAAVERFLAAETIPWEHKRENETRSYDIRAQVARSEHRRDRGRSRRHQHAAEERQHRLRPTGAGRRGAGAAAAGAHPPHEAHTRVRGVAGATGVAHAWAFRGLSAV